MSTAWWIFRNRPELTILAIVGIAAFGYLEFFSSPVPLMPNSGVADLEKTLIDVNGVLLGFSGIMIAQILASSQSKINPQLSGPSRAQPIFLGYASVNEAISVLVYFTISIVASVILLTGADRNPSGTTEVADAVVFPLTAMIAALIAIGSFLRDYAKSLFQSAKDQLRGEIKGRNELS